MELKNFLLLALLFCSPVLADQQQAQQYCPNPADLRKYGILWKADNIWRSYEQSFSSRIAGFIEAQWIGIKVGKIICLYQGDAHLDFPIALETIHPSLVPVPTGEGWTETKEGYKKCVSSDVKDCSFTVQQPEDTSNIYEQIKYAPKPDDQEGG